MPPAAADPRRRGAGPRPMDGFLRLQESHYASQANPLCDTALKQTLERLAGRFPLGARARDAGDGVDRPEPLVARLRAQQQALARLGRNLPVGHRLMRRVARGREVDAREVRKVGLVYLFACLKGCIIVVRRVGLFARSFVP
eukprot:evm.model.scf_544.6 EVM.evm.TU.scf_544.6   scf_544:30839-31264(+)